MALAPIVLFVYNRPWHTRQTVEALKRNLLAKESDLIIYSDAARNEANAASVASVREYIETIDGFKSVLIKKAPQNQGLANSIIKGISEVIEQHEKVIVLEDDLITSKYFLTYLNSYLELYQKDNTIWSVSGYSLPIELPTNYSAPVYLSKRSWSWGFGTWKDRWKKVDWDTNNYERDIIKQFDQAGGTDLKDMLTAQMNNEIDSWYVRWQFNQFIDNSFCIYPRNSLIQNTGHDGSGVHCTNTNRYIQSITDEQIALVKSISFDEKIQQKIYQFNTSNAGLKFVRLLLKKLKLYQTLRTIKRWFF